MRIEVAASTSPTGKIRSFIGSKIDIAVKHSA